MHESSQPARLIFIGGAPRSGTTLLQNMLDSHPAVLGGPEFLHIFHIIELRNRLQRSLSRGYINLIISSEEVDTRIRQLIESFLLPFAARNRAAILSEKTPTNILVFPELLSLFPEARFLLVVRDPRAIVASMLEVAARARSKGMQPSTFTRSLEAAVKRVKDCYSAGFEAANHRPERVLAVVYEELVRNPDRESKRICDFLGLEWSSGMLAPSSKKHLGEQAITTNTNEVWYDARTYNSNPFTDSLEKWKRTLTPAQQVTVSREFSDNPDFRVLGYDFTAQSVDARTWKVGLLTSTFCGWKKFFSRKTVGALRKLQLIDV